MSVDFNNEDAWMNYTTGDEIRYSKNGRFGVVVNVDEVNHTYTIDVDGDVIYNVSECELA